MNIIVRTNSGRYIVRPDTTWEKDNEDFFPPEFVRELSFSPVVFARICKPGRSVGQNFASRYYDLMGFGVLLYPHGMIDGSEEGFAAASCLDHTSFLPSPTESREEFCSSDSFEIRCLKGNSGTCIFRHSGFMTSDMEKAIAEATRFIYIRTGDLIAVELAPREALCKAEDGTVRVTGSKEGKEPSLDFNIVF